MNVDRTNRELSAPSNLYLRPERLSRKRTPTAAFEPALKPLKMIYAISVTYIGNAAMS